MSIGRVERVGKAGLQVIYDAAAVTPTKPGAPSAIMRTFSQIKPETLKWLWPGRIPLGKLTLLVGDPGLGKSLATIDVAARISRGAAFADGTQCEAGEVIFLSAEDDPADTIRPRLDAAGADVARIHILEAVRVTLMDGAQTEKAFNLETDLAALEAVLQQHPGVRLIVIDPISAYLGGVDSHSNAEVRGMLAPLASLAARHGVAILCVTHLRKSGGNAVHRAIASIAFAAAARAVWAVAPDPSDADRRLMLAVKQNLAANIGGLAFRIETQNDLPRLKWESEAVTLDANDVLNVEDREEHSERREAEEWLREYLTDGPIEAREAIRTANNVGISKMMLWRAGNALHVVRHKLGGRGAGWEWSLPDHPKISTLVYTDVKSLKPLDSRMETKADSAPSNSKISRSQDRGSLESLPLRDSAGWTAPPPRKVMCLNCGEVQPSAVALAHHLENCKSNGRSRQ